ncbi:phosphatase [Opitutus sp. GAS368]|uniref:Ppx/GppA phosphatase family protein n=1 Tax=Opitutus sp. GAS368 TaxID=1882749 RepID=UPI001E2AD7EF|nr:phosphatase [Opitutus sp. GAS368]
MVNNTPTVAVIDIGSNSIKVLVAARDKSGAVTELTSRTIDARISAGIGKAKPQLTEEGMARGLAAVQELLADAAPFAPAKTILVATSAVRDAGNGADFRRRVKAATGYDIRILSGDEEANLIGRGLTCDPALADLKDFYVFDLGGGSLECLFFHDRQIQQAMSLQLGCVRLTERFIQDPAGPLPPHEGQALARHVWDELKRSGFRFPVIAPAAVFAGGSMTTVRAIKGARHGLALENTPAIIGTDTLSQLLDEVAPMTLEERKAIPGLPAARADVFPAALITIVTVADYAHIARFHHSLHNLRWGLAAEALASLG